MEIEGGREGRKVQKRLMGLMEHGKETRKGTKEEKKRRSNEGGKNEGKKDEKR